MNHSSAIERRAAPSFPSSFILAAVCSVAVLVAYWGGIENLVHRWSEREEYSHGFFIPLICLWLLWHRRDAITESIGCPSWLGVPLFLAALVLLFLGELSSIFVLIHLSLVLLLFAGALLFGGNSLMKVVALPLSYLLFAIPVPYFIDAQLSWWLQLVSSKFGAGILQAMSVPVFQEGNVIDLGTYQLQVAEACSGLRYLYPLLGLGFLVAYLFAAPLWQRVLIFLSVVPITVFMNSFRIAVIGVLVNRWGTSMAEGFLHFFEGWVIFLGCGALLLFEVWLLDRLQSGRPLAELLAVPQVFPVYPAEVPVGRSWLSLTAVAALVLASFTAFQIENREDVQPQRISFGAFPRVLGSWEGRDSFLNPVVETALGVDDYFLANYQSGDGSTVNLYMAWYASQRKGNSPHSPRVCIPSGGWRIVDLKRPELSVQGAAPFPINRAELELNGKRMLVYYWFDQRSRRMANEYWMKWYLLIDAIVRNRTDGALVRLTTPLLEGESDGDADARLQDMVRLLLPGLPDFVPH
ncbi:MAG: VPLPA-CTERM-specific exosortase XrtD [Pseudomonadota bacterium]